MKCAREGFDPISQICALVRILVLSELMTFDDFLDDDVERPLDFTGFV
jgi:hypothetical protein